MIDLSPFRWPTFVGAAVAIGLAVALPLSGASDGAEWGRTFVAVPLGAWALAGLALAVGLLVQLLLNGHDSVLRERRLVQTSAALREATAQLEHLATTDPLTGILNRRAFFDRFAAELRRSQRYGRSLAVVMFDLDGFKDMNDRWGHPFGDFVLAETTRIVTENLRDSDVVARYGGEEIVLLLPETTSEQAQAVAEKLREAIAEHPFRLPGGQPDDVAQITVSAGVASVPLSEALAVGDLIGRADRALYVAKRSGKNRVVVDEEQPAAMPSDPPA
ncbi:MAG: GGDEF domain-containing protein [Chloroflexi bacterium]|nr:GGDEF domain-containing protein [Chloroflexota bacterium]MDA1001818.1 GGDEF domain-containing protein [Chloroflexota bacterium]MQC27473.1 GGDEF domain-containing protein [Chloroflexota bacterium]